MMNTIDHFDRLVSHSAHVTIVAVREYRLKAFSCDTPLLVLPLAGLKRLRLGGQCFECTRASFLMVHRGLSFDVENIPDNDTPYRALAVAFPWRLLDLARSMLARQPRQVSAAVGDISKGDFNSVRPALIEYLEADPHNPVALDHRALGLLLALAQAGHDAFLNAGDPSFAARVRCMIAAAPARDWDSSQLEASLCVSGATLRRRLQEEGTSFRALLLDVRLHHALFMLQTSVRRPVKAVAQACGYRSVPSFSRAFADRFGVEPSRIAAD
jgi:AraC-like DNA-binding protein